MTTRTRLEDGWGVDTPVGDTLLRRYLLNLAAFHESVATAMGGRTLRRDDVHPRRDAARSPAVRLLGCDGTPTARGSIRSPIGRAVQRHEPAGR
jgi:hypothetical protein